MKKSYNYYITGSILYAVIGILALALLPYAFNMRNYLLFAVCIFIIALCLDLFFCGCRARTCGIKKEGHYVIPPFLKP